LTDTRWPIAPLAKTHTAKSWRWAVLDNPGFGIESTLDRRACHIPYICLDSRDSSAAGGFGRSHVPMFHREILRRRIRNKLAPETRNHTSSFNEVFA
jgi:hypothetical protein